MPAWQKALVALILVSRILKTERKLFGMGAGQPMNGWHPSGQGFYGRIAQIHYRGQQSQEKFW